MDSMEKTRKCDHHLCESKAQKYRCRFCGRYYCEEHIKPKPPAMPLSTAPELDRELLGAYRHDEGHACGEYMAQWSEEKRKEKILQTKVLKNIIKSPEEGIVLKDYEPSAGEDRPRLPVKGLAPLLMALLFLFLLAYGFLCLK